MRSVKTIEGRRPKSLDVLSGLRGKETESKETQSADEQGGASPEVPARTPEVEAPTRGEKPSVGERLRGIPWSGTPPEGPATEAVRVESVRDRFRFVPWEPSRQEESGGDHLSEEEANELAAQQSVEKTVRHFFSKMK